MCRALLIVLAAMFFLFCSCTSEQDTPKGEKSPSRKPQVSFSLLYMDIAPLADGGAYLIPSLFSNDEVWYLRKTAKIKVRGLPTGLGGDISLKIAPLVDGGAYLKTDNDIYYLREAQAFKVENSTIDALHDIEVSQADMKSGLFTLWQHERTKRMKLEDEKYMEDLFQD